MNKTKTKKKNVKTILVDPEVWKKLKLYCVQNDLVIGDVVADLVMDFLFQSNKHSSSAINTAPKTGYGRAEQPHMLTSDDVEARYDQEPPTDNSGVRRK